MKKHIEELDGPKSSWLFLLVKSLIVLAFIGIAACVCLAPIFAMVNLMGAIGEAIGGVAAGFFWFALSAYIILNVEWSQLAWLLLMLLGWLLSDGLP